MLSKALIIFVDIRGFTSWSGDADVHANVVEFVEGFDKILASEFQDYYRKPLGDGGMMIRKVKAGEYPVKIIEEVLDIIGRVEKAFDSLCSTFSDTHGVRTDLHLGWGITRGDVWSRRSGNTDDFVGKNINEAARLCGIARPRGVVIDSDEFRELPELQKLNFQRQVVDIHGFNTPINAWVTKEVANFINPMAYARENPLVFVSGVCLRRIEGLLEVLVMKRHLHREFFPGLLEVTTGGQLAKDETFKDGVIRHFRRQLALEVSVDEKLFSTYQFSNRDGELIPGVRYLCWYISGQPLLHNYDEFHWLSPSKFADVPAADFMPGVQKDVINLLGKIENDL